MRKDLKTMIPVSRSVRQQIRRICKKEKRQYDAVLQDMVNLYQEGKE